MDTSEIGRYGTVSFMKRLDPDKVVAAFPIDDDHVTFGRDPLCSVRLYYTAVSPLHCKIIFQERKAFLVVVGANGVVVDGCRVFPSASAPAIIPLTNNSEIEIHSKRFRFTYPPKELREVLLATPRVGSAATPSRRRALRMSMIQSAQVFSPAPSTKPLDNLRILQSPIKPFKTPSKDPASGLQSTNSDNESDDDQEVVLVDGDAPIVVQEEKDLVILENVEIEETDASDDQFKTPTRQTHTPVPSTLQRFPQPSSVFQTPSRQMVPYTPRQRGHGSALHRAVLIRSAQRAIMQAEVEREEAEEEREVEEFIAPRKSSNGSVSSTTSSEDASEEDEDERVPITDREEEDTVMLNWRQRFEDIEISSSNEKGHAITGEYEQEVDITDVDIQVEPIADRDEQIAHALESIYDRDNKTLDVAERQENPLTTPTPGLPRRFTNFSTPQVSRVGNRAQGPGRYSYGGTGLDDGGLRRVAIEQAWRVKDIVLPDSTPSIKEEQEEDAAGWTSPGGGTAKRRPPLSDEERKAIKERRRSALTTPDAFFGGQLPGMRRLSAVPMSPARQLGLSTTPSPTKDTPPPQSHAEPEPLKIEDEETKFNRLKDEDHELGTRALLEKMKETIEGMKRRKSLNPRDPRVGLGLGRSPTKSTTTTEGLGFSLLAPGVKEELESALQLAREAVEESRNEDNAMVSDNVPVESHSRGHTPLQATTEDDEGLRTPRPSTRLLPTGPMSTPKMNDLRHLFGAPRGTATPSFKGMKNLFGLPVTSVPETPVFEGLGEMMKTPEQYRYSRQNDTQDMPGMGSREDAEDEPVVVRRKGGRTRAAALTVENEPESQEQPAARGRRGRSRLVDGNSEVKEVEGTKPKGRVLRGAKKTVEDAQDDALDKTGRSSPLERNTRSRDEVKEENPDSEASPNDVATTNRGRKDEDSREPASKPQPRRGRGRTPVRAEPGLATTAEVEPLPPVPAIGSRRRTPRSNTQTPESDPPVPAPPSTEKAQKVRVRSRAQQGDGSAKGQRTTRAKAIEVEDGDDPLDSIGVLESEGNGTSGESAKAKRATRSSRVTPKTEKEEERPSTGSKRAAAAAKSGGGGGGRVLRGGSAEVASPPNGVTDKENACVEEEGGVVEKTSKVRVSRSKKSAAEKEPVESVEGAPVAKTRVTRARARK